MTHPHSTCVDFVVPTSICAASDCADPSLLFGVEQASALDSKRSSTLQPCEEVLHGA